MIATSHTRDIYSFERTTDDIRVSVMPIFMDEESKPEKHFYLWAYQVRIENLSKTPITILDRQWHVIDAMGGTKDISGPGVFKEKTALSPGDSFEYTNTIPLSTTSGFITGTYALETTPGTFTEISAPVFSLDSPYQSKTLN